jgi:hypothetical protein
MRTLVIGALAATLVGCSCFVSPQSGIEACTGADGSGFACFDRSAAVGRLDPAIEPKSSVDPGTTTPRERTALTSRTAKSSSAHTDRKIRHTARAEKSATAKVEPAPAAQPDPIDPVVDRAKIAVAVKLENPASVAFSEMNRAMRTNTLGQSVDTICGHVKSKKTSGDIGDRPFLYLVKDDEAYVADDSPTSAASTAYRNICN